MSQSDAARNAFPTGLYKDLERRIESSPPGLCPVDLSRAFLDLCHAQTCGKCVPCRIGLGQLSHFITDVLDGKATLETLDVMEELARSIMDSADCAIGYEAAHMVYKGLIGYREDYEEHIRQGRCTCTYHQPVPCVSLCPAEVDIPGYIALVGEGRYADAIRLIRKDNPFPTSCGFICEHPCEARCRRNMVDDKINIRGLKRVASDFAGKVPAPSCAKSTGKRIAIVGGGPCGLSSAYYLQLMGHQTTVYEMLPQLGGMLRYGIPNYRLPKEELDHDIQAILDTGVEVRCNERIGDQISIQQLRKEYDAVLISIGAFKTWTSTPSAMAPSISSGRAVMSAIRRRYTILTFLAPRRIAVRTASIETFPPPITATSCPLKSGLFPSPTSRKKWTAEITPSASSPSIPSFLSVLAPMEISTSLRRWSARSKTDVQVSAPPEKRIFLFPVQH